MVRGYSAWLWCREMDRWVIILRVYLLTFRMHNEGSKQGKGKFTWPDGSVYEGNFENNLMEGFGKIQWADGKEYEGHWKDNQMHGKGIFKWPDGRVY